MAKFRLGIVGCGDIAGYMAWLARLHPKIQLTACCDSNSEKAKSFARKHRIPQVFTGYSDLLARGDLDAVYLAVPHHLHLPLADQAIQARIPVFLEKPLACTVADGLSLVETCLRHEVKVGVNYQYRYDSGCYALRRAVQSGALGAVFSVRINVPWRRERSYFQQSGWHTSLAQSGGGTLITQGSHFLDIALWALDEQPLSCVGYTQRSELPDVEVEDLAMGIVQMKSGALIQISSTMAAAREQAVTIEVYGEAGTARYTNQPVPRISFRGIRVKKEKPPVRGLHALQRSLEGFRRWVVSDEDYLTPAEAALPALSVVESIYRSAESGRRENIAIPSVPGKGVPNENSR